MDGDGEEWVLWGCDVQGRARGFGVGLGGGEGVSGWIGEVDDLGGIA